MTERINADYVRGFADRLCQINIRGSAIIITTNRTSILRRVYAFLTRNGIACNIKTCGSGRAMLRVGKRSSLERWRDLIGFNDPASAAKLERILS